MFQSNNSIINVLFLVLAFHASADVEMKPPDEKRIGRYRPLSEEYQKFDRDDLRGMTAEKLGRMPLEDPLLRHAYISIFFRNLRESDTLEPEEAVVVEDMRRRGDSITPLLLDLARQNQDSIFESALLGDIADVGKIDLDPYLEYARKLLRERIQTINYSLAASASDLLADHGSIQDMALLEHVIAERSYMARRVTDSLEVLKRRLERLERVKQASRPILRGEPSASEAATGNVAENATKESVASRDGHISTKSWMIWASFGMVIGAILIWRWKSQSTSRKPPSGPI